ncbi:MAG TPA: peptidyl-prolyl cis-trans isomerase, partial [Vicinamibacterales bacterium]|nr:peptidyl-prolyl cis-trans isomerase [Vicinamibacterales bacterium]
KMVDNQAEVVRPLDAVKPEIADQLRWQKAQQDAEAQAKALASAAKAPADLDRLAGERSLELHDSGLFLPTDPIDGLGLQAELAAAMFALKEGEISTPQRVARGWVIGTVSGRQDAYVPALDEVKDRVRDDVVRQKAAELAKQRAAGIAAELKSAKDFAATAKKYKLEVKPTELLARGSAIPDIGMSDAVDAAAFSLPLNGVSDPISTPTATAIVRVVERQEVTDAQIASGRDELREEMTGQRRDRFFSAYMQKAKTNLKININQDTLAQVLGPATPQGLPPVQ